MVYGGLKMYDDYVSSIGLESSRIVNSRNWNSLNALFKFVPKARLRMLQIYRGKMISKIKFI